MPTTRSSAASKDDSNGAPVVGEKRAAERTVDSGSKRVRSESGKSGSGQGKKQKTIDEMVDVGGGKAEEEGKDVKDDVREVEENMEKGKEKEDKNTEVRGGKQEEKEEENGQEPSSSRHQDSPSKNATSNSTDSSTQKSSKAQSPTQTKHSSVASTSTSTILERGLIYFFLKPRVNTTSPHSISDVARTYLILRPLPRSSPLNDNTLARATTVRMLALPKKTLPQSKRDRFLTFVEKAQAGIDEVRDALKGSEYVTKTKGTSHQHSSIPFASGIYTLTHTTPVSSTSSVITSYLAYHLTTPATQIPSALGLTTKGSFITSVKNPQTPSPPSANATYMKPATYEGVLQEQFEGRRWGAVTPEYLDVVGSQVLFIGDGRGTFGGAVGVDGDRDESTNDTKTGESEATIEKLEDEDHDRVASLEDDDPIFADLGLSLKDFEGLQTTW